MKNDNLFEVGNKFFCGLPHLATLYFLHFLSLHWSNFPFHLDFKHSRPGCSPKLAYFLGTWFKFNFVKDLMKQNFLSLQVWPGYMTSVDNFHGGVLLQCDVSHRVLRTESALDVMTTHMKRGFFLINSSFNSILIFW